MPRLTDPAAIRDILDTDRGWGVYLRGDLHPPLFAHSHWYGDTSSPPALLLVYRGFDTPVLAALGPAEKCARLLPEIPVNEPYYPHVPRTFLPALKARFDVSELLPMRRMLLDPAQFQLAKTDGVVRLGPEHVAAVQKLFADGASAGESPHFFLPSMLEDGVFCGSFEGTELVAAAGTHLVVAAEGVAAVGNIYTRRDRRGRGLAAQTTTAVVQALLDMRIPTIGLNVHEENTAAIRVYERLGFAHYCDFYEGMVVPRHVAAAH